MLFGTMGSKQPVALLVEDEPLIAFDLAEALRDVGIDPVLHFSCATANAWLLAHLPDIAILDVNLGDGVCGAAAATLVARKIPFIVHSADVTFAEDHTIFSCGRRIDKPCTSTDVAASAMMLLLAADISGPALTMDGVSDCA